MRLYSSFGSDEFLCDFARVKSDIYVYIQMMTTNVIDEIDENWGLHFPKQQNGISFLSLTGGEIEICTMDSFSILKYCR